MDESPPDILRSRWGNGGGEGQVLPCQRWLTVSCSTFCELFWRVVVMPAQGTACETGVPRSQEIPRLSRKGFESALWGEILAPGLRP